MDVIIDDSNIALLNRRDYPGMKIDDLVKSQDLDGFEKCSRSRRANSEEGGVVGLRRNITAGQAQDAAQRRYRTFYETVKIAFPTKEAQSLR